MLLAAAPEKGREGGSPSPAPRHGTEEEEEEERSLSLSRALPYYIGMRGRVGGPLVWGMIPLWLVGVTRAVAVASERACHWRA